MTLLLRSPIYIRERIVPLQRRAPWLEAREIAKPYGGLPSGGLLNTHLHVPNYRHWLGNTVWNIDCAFPFVARELLAYPARNQQFQRGKDVIDRESGWVLPARYLTDPTIANNDPFIKNANLVIDPQDIRLESYGHEENQIVHPRSIRVLNPKWSCKFERVDFEAIRIQVFPNPLISSLFPIHAFYLPSEAFEVGRVARDIADTKGKILVEDVSLAEIQALATGQIPECLKVLRPAQLEALKQLATQPLLEQALTGSFLNFISQ